MDEESFALGLAGLFSRRPDVFEGIGDDAAALDLNLPGGLLLLAAADQVLCNVHYLPGTPPGKVAAKLLKRNISDIAAMGGIPTHAMVSVALNPLDETFLRDFHRGLEACAAAYGVSVVGGDTARLPSAGQVCSLSILGTVPREKLCLRRNARPGDFVYATGEFGNSFRTGWHLDFLPRVEAASFLAGTYTCAMMDVSDGLVKDLRRMAAASSCAVRLLEPEKRIPLRSGAAWRTALSDGEDYELIFAVPPSRAESLERSWPFRDIPLSRIGEFLPGTPGNLENAELCSAETGYDHFHEN